MRKIKKLFLLLASLLPHLLIATCGKVDLGPVYAHIDVLESGKTFRRLDLSGLKGEVSYLIWKGLCVKPNFLYGWQGRSHLFSGGLNFGQCIPFCNETLILTPSIGCFYTDLKTHFSIDSPFATLRVRQRFRSVSPYLGLECTWNFAATWRICLQYQYCYSRSHTVSRIPFLGKRTDNSQAWGPNYGLLLEKDLTPNFSLNAGAAYNISLSKEKHGLRGYGIKFGMAYWY